MQQARAVQFAQDCHDAAGARDVVGVEAAKALRETGVPLTITLTTADARAGLTAKNRTPAPASRARSAGRATCPSSATSMAGTRGRCRCARSG